MKDYVKAWPFYLIPHHLVSRLIFWLTRRESKWVAPAIEKFSRKFSVDLTEAKIQDLNRFRTFNEFFTRELKPGARPVDERENILVSPVDGAISQAGGISDGKIFQAKGHSYTVEALLGGDQALAAQFHNGQFSTIYLSPRDYHRIHMPCSGRLRQQIHVPGRLFSVAPFTVNVIPGLFARNERVVTLFDTEFGPLAMVLVGAINVAAIETVWAGLITPPKGKKITVRRYEHEMIRLEKGDEMGRFNMGSTVILLTNHPDLHWPTSPQPGSKVKLGEAFMTLERTVTSS